MKKFKLDGIKEIMLGIKELPAKFKGQVIASVHREILNKQVKNSLKAASPSSNIRQAVAVKSTRQVTKNKSSMGIGITSNAYYSRFLEKGSTNRYTKGTGYYKKKAFRGRITKRPFIQRTYDMSLNNVNRAINEQYGEIIHKVLSRKQKSIRKKIM